MLKKQSILFNDPHLHYPIDNATLPFSDYITRCKDIILHTRVDLEKPNREKIIAANTPFELVPSHQGKYGALLIHGLLDCPFLLRDIGEHLQKKGLLVRSILLPGHGTVPGGLLHVTYEEWLQTVRYGIATFKKEVDQIFLVGYSTGASLALHEAMEDTSFLAGLILFAPALKIHSSLDFTAGMFRHLEKISKRAAWFHIDPHETIDYARYSSITFNAAYQVYRLANAIKHSLLSLPLFFIASEDDATVRTKVTLDYFKKQLSSLNRFILYSTDPYHTKNKNIIMRNAIYPDMHIRNISHLGITNAPSNLHYGIEGDYPYGSHVFKKNNTLYGEYNEAFVQFHNYLYQFHLKKTKLERLTFNPDFPFLIENIDQFINEILKR
jgi:esterase/lipase